MAGGKNKGKGSLLKHRRSTRTPARCCSCSMRSMAVWESTRWPVCPGCEMSSCCRAAWSTSPRFIKLGFSNTECAIRCYVVLFQATRDRRGGREPGAEAGRALGDKADDWDRAAIAQGASPHPRAARSNGPTPTRRRHMCRPCFKLTIDNS